MTEDIEANATIGFFVEDAHYTLAELEIDEGIYDEITGAVEDEELEPDHEDGSGMVFDYSDAREVIGDEVAEEEVKDEILEDYAFALAYLNGEEQEYLEQNWGSNGVLIAENWSRKIVDRLDSGEVSMDDFDLGEAKVAVTYGDVEQTRRSYMKSTLWERNHAPRNTAT